jgi:hypothetical protein
MATKTKTTKPIHQVAPSKKPTAKGFTPWVAPTTAPEGSYDPQLDAQGQTQSLNNLYQNEDFGTGNQQALDDYNTAIANAAQAHGYTLADLQTASNQDLANYNLATQNLGQQYQRLGVSQTQNANAAGVGEGGALVAAQTARQGNQNQAQGVLDTNESRSQADITQRVNRENTAYAQNQAANQTNYDRGVSSRAQTNERDNAANTLFNQQLGTQKVYAASASGLLPGPPSNEFTTPKGTAYRVVIHQGIKYHQMPDGTLHAIGKA